MQLTLPTCDKSTAGSPIKPLYSMILCYSFVRSFQITVESTVLFVFLVCNIVMEAANCGAYWIRNPQ